MYDELYKNIKKYRKALGKTQNEIANVLGISRSTYSYYEAGKIIPDLKKIAELSKYYGIPISNFLGSEKKEVLSDSKKTQFTELDFKKNNSEIYLAKTENEKKVLKFFKEMNLKNQEIFLEMMKIMLNLND